MCLEGHLHNCRKKSNAASTGKQLQFMELHYMNMYTTAMHSKSWNCTLHQHADDCNAFQVMKLHTTTTRRRLQCIPSHETAHYINTQTTAIHYKTWSCTTWTCTQLQCIPSHATAHYINTPTTAMHSKIYLLHVCDDSLILVLSRDVNFLLDIIHVRLGHVRIPR